MNKYLSTTKYSRQFVCPKCGLVHKVESTRDDLDAKEVLRIQACIRRQK